jgi:hypothetical protein
MQHAQRLVEGRAGHRGDEHAVRTTQGALQFLGRVRLLCIDDEFGPELLRQLEFLVIDVDCGDVKSHCLGVLNRHVAEAADTRDRNPIAGLAFEHLETFVNRDAGAKHRRHGREVDVRRQVTDVTGSASTYSA